MEMLSVPRIANLETLHRKSWNSQFTNPEMLSRNQKSFEMWIILITLLKYESQSSDGWHSKSPLNIIIIFIVICIDNHHRWSWSSLRKFCRWNPSNLVRNIWAIYGEHPTIHRRSYTRPLPLLIVKWLKRILGLLCVLAWNPLFWTNINCNWRDINKYASGKI